jgi:hypothetical protein
MGKAKVCKLFPSRRAGGLISFQASQTKGLHCTSMLLYETSRGKGEADMDRIHDSMNLQYTLHANIEAFNNVGLASRPCAPVLYFFANERKERTG